MFKIKIKEINVKEIQNRSKSEISFKNFFINKIIMILIFLFIFYLFFLLNIKLLIYIFYYNLSDLKYN